MSNSNNPIVKITETKRKYGSRKGLLYTWIHKILYSLLFYRQYEKINWSSVKRLVFVCKGNICRSAYADTITLSMGLDSVSCGLDTTEGEPAYEKAISTAAIFDCDLTKHRTTCVQSMHFEKSDLLIAMEPEQIKELIKLSNGICQYTLLGLWGGVKLPHLHDPYGSPDEYFETCFKRINEAVDAIIEKTRG